MEYSYLCKLSNMVFWIVLLCACLTIVVGYREGQLRLIGGRNKSEGTLVIYHNRRWGSICDDEWDLKDARVACQQMGFPGAKRAARRSEFGRGRSRVWMSRVRCSGFEHELRYCMFFGWGRIRYRCRYGSSSAGAVCMPKIPKTTTTTTTTTTPKPTTTIKTTTVNNRAHDKPTTRRTSVWKYDGPKPTVSKSGKTAEELVLEDEDHNRKMMAGGRNSSREIQADAPSATGLSLRLRGGRYYWEGRLEVKRSSDERWGTICGTNWTIREAMVACRELGLDYGKQALQVNYFGGENMDKYYNQIRCNGRENTLDECEKTETAHNIACNKKNMVAGIVCSKFLPDLIPDLEVLEESVVLEDKGLFYLLCALEENCLSSSAAVVRNTSNWMGATRRLFKFSTVVHNRGLADFRPYRAKGQWEWHDCHMHYHSMEVFAHYDLIDEHGNRLVEGSKASFCLEDTTCDDGVTPKYDCTGYGDQGLSVNCSDNYLNDIDCQWIDITDIPVGKYTFKMEVNPSLLVAELDYDNNVAVCGMWYSGYNAKLHDCRFESLL